MDANELRAMQAPIKDRYKSEPDAALITLKAKGTLDDQNIACKVETGRALAVAGLHPATGGSGMELCSGDMLLEALVACAGVTLKAVSTALAIPLKSGTVSAEGDLDFRGTLGVAKDAPVGFREIRLRFDVDTDAPQEKLDAGVTHDCHAREGGASGGLILRRRLLVRPPELVIGPANGRTRWRMMTI
jgi:uncharacterized OsmC-like protein